MIELQFNKKVNFNKNYYAIDNSSNSEMIIIDYQNCIPIQNLTINCITSNPQKFKFYQNEDLVDQFQQTIQGSVQEQSRFIIVIQSTVDEQLYSQMNCYYSGPAGPYFQNPDTVILESIKNQRLNTQPQLSIQVQETINGASIEFICDQRGYIYFMVSTQPISQDGFIEKVKSQTIKKNVFITDYDPIKMKNKDKNWRNQIQYGIYTHKAIHQLNNILNDANYYTLAICENYDGNFSNFTDSNWNHIYDQGMATLIYFEFSMPLNKNYLSMLARALVIHFNLKDYQVFTDYGDQQLSHHSYIQSDAIVDKIFINKFINRFTIIPDPYSKQNQSNSQIKAQLAIASELQALVQISKIKIPNFQIINAACIDKDPKRIAHIEYFSKQSVMVDNSKLYSEFEISQFSEKAVVMGYSQYTAKTPTCIMLKQGLDGENKPLLGVKIGYTKKNAGNINLEFSQLQFQQFYKVFSCLADATNGLGNDYDLVSTYYVQALNSRKNFFSVIVLIIYTIIYT